MSLRSVGKIASSNRQVGVVMQKDIVEAIDSRRDAQSMTRSKYVALIVAKWFADGCPAVNEADRAMKVMRAADQPLKTKRKAA